MSTRKDRRWIISLSLVFFLTGPVIYGLNKSLNLGLPDLYLLFLAGALAAIIFAVTEYFLLK